jgi:Macrocin-O-methyltransferase (TylF)
MVLPTWPANWSLPRERCARRSRGLPPQSVFTWSGDGSPETFPEAAPAIKPVAILHADGDWYESVRLTLETFEPQVNLGGFVVIDDYGFWEGAKEATHEYRVSRGIDASLVEVDQTAVFWRKP